MEKKTVTDFEKFFKRLCEEVALQTQADLARYLNVSRASVNIAKRFGTVPGKWLVTVCQKRVGSIEYFLGVDFANGITLSQEHAINRMLLSLNSDARRRRQHAKSKPQKSNKKQNENIIHKEVKRSSGKLESEIQSSGALCWAAKTDIQLSYHWKNVTCPICLTKRDEQ